MHCNSPLNTDFYQCSFVSMVKNCLKAKCEGESKCTVIISSPINLFIQVILNYLINNNMSITNILVDPAGFEPAAFTLRT